MRLSDVMPEKIQWLWPGKIAVGKLTLLAGDPGLGKSILTIDLAARVTTGAAWPDNPGAAAPRGSVLLMSAEDGLADTIAPRLHATSADVSKVIALTGIPLSDGRERAVDLTRDIPRIESTIEEVGDCRLLVIDPVSAYLGSTDGHDNTSVRGVLAPLSALAEKHRMAVVAVDHLRKGDGPAIYRHMGSLAFVAAARTGWVVAKDKADPTRRLFIPTKSNIAPDQHGMGFRVVATPSNVPVLSWDNDPVTVTADEALSRPRRPKRPARENAGEWLQRQLASGPVPSAELRRRAAEDRIPWRTVERAKKDLGATSKRSGFQGVCSWCLGDHSPPDTPVNDKLAVYGGQGDPDPIDRQKNTKTANFETREEVADIGNHELAVFGDYDLAVIDEDDPEWGDL